MTVGTLRKENDDWYVVYFVSGDDVDAFARVEMKLAEEDYESAVEGERIHFQPIKRKGKFFAKVQDLKNGTRYVNEHLIDIILGQ